MPTCSILRSIGTGYRFAQVLFADRRYRPALRRHRGHTTRLRCNNRGGERRGATGGGGGESLPEVERVMPAEAHNNHRDTPRKSNGTTRAGRCTDASPARQARTISPEQSLKHRCQAVPGRLNRPALLVQCPRLCWLGCAVLRSSWPHGDSKPTAVCA